MNEGDLVHLFSMLDCCHIQLNVFDTTEYKVRYWRFTIFFANTDFGYSDFLSSVISKIIVTST